ncbi:hypothetical protein [Euzebya pacifica]|uniref:hypothetical protein n=1 Tax=Euzebya pacifica TaxID=1608957 RepID=UPI0013DF617E|nr:hypothetical protein [Euzebya pacifica]
MHTVVPPPPDPSPTTPSPTVPFPPPRPADVPVRPGLVWWTASRPRRRHAVVLAMLLLAGCATADANPDATPLGHLGSSEQPIEAAVTSVE